MEIHSVEVISIKKNTIEHRVLKSKWKVKTYSFVLLLLIPVLAFACLRLFGEANYNDMTNSICASLNPIYTPYVQTGEIVFTWNYQFDEFPVDFEMPIHSSDIKLDEGGTVTAKVKESIMVKSIADGVVDKVENIDGENIVTIVYYDNFKVEYINLDIVGVIEGNVVEKGKEIGTAKLNDEVRFKAYLNNEQIKNFKIENNKIVWQS